MFNRISWADAMKNPFHNFDMSTTSIASNQTAQVHISYISKQMDTVIDEYSIARLFSNFGQVVDVVLKKTQRVRESNFF